MSRFFCELCDEFWPEDYASEVEGLCTACAEHESEEHPEEDEEYEFLFDDDDDDFDDPFG